MGQPKTHNNINNLEFWGVSIHENKNFSALRQKSNFKYRFSDLIENKQGSVRR